MIKNLRLCIKSRTLNHIKKDYGADILAAPNTPITFVLISSIGPTMRIV